MHKEEFSVCVRVSETELHQENKTSTEVLRPTRQKEFDVSHVGSCLTEALR